MRRPQTDLPRPSKYRQRLKRRCKLSRPSTRLCSRSRPPQPPLPRQLPRQPQPQPPPQMPLGQHPHYRRRRQWQQRWQIEGRMSTDASTLAREIRTAKTAMAVQSHQSGGVLGQRDPAQPRGQRRRRPRCAVVHTPPLAAGATQAAAKAAQPALSILQYSTRPPRESIRYGTLGKNQLVATAVPDCAWPRCCPS